LQRTQNHNTVKRLPIFVAHLKIKRFSHLLSADTKEERIEWCNKFNAALLLSNAMGW
jgi:hypothetical protein